MRRRRKKKKRGKEEEEISPLYSILGSAIAFIT